MKDKQKLVIHSSPSSNCCQELFAILVLISAFKNIPRESPRIFIPQLRICIHSFITVRDQSRVSLLRSMLRLPLLLLPLLLLLLLLCFSAQSWPFEGRGGDCRWICHYKRQSQAAVGMPL
jgi:hypothetical protein